MPETPLIRPLALAVVRRGEDLLVFEGRDEVKDETYHRPLGGGIEFGETAAEAVRQIAVLENLFTFDGRPRHEIVFLFAADLVDKSIYGRDEVGIVLDDGSRVHWLPLGEVLSGKAILYPAGLAELLSAQE